MKFLKKPLAVLMFLFYLSIPLWIQHIPEDGVIANLFFGSKYRFILSIYGTSVLVFSILVLILSERTVFISLLILAVLFGLINSIIKGIESIALIAYYLFSLIGAYSGVGIIRLFQFIIEKWKGKKKGEWRNI